jgi:copper homeostasis protein CutC
MLADIEFAKRSGADGVVIGVLTPEGRIDTEATKRLVQVSSVLFLA